MFLFYVLSFFKKGDTIQGGTLFKGGYYLRKYGTYPKFSHIFGPIRIGFQIQIHTKEGANSFKSTPSFRVIQKLRKLRNWSNLAAVS